ncbi:MAG: RidA family protein [Candidatus Latescibacteria bacterium]|nr:RidA family protein [Candidatus Latescibacterota bacterium]
MEQACSMYSNLYHLLRAHGARPSDVLTEKVFFSDVDRQFHDLREVRRECYNGTSRTIEHEPATLFLHQPPCHPGRLCELQAYAMFPAGDAKMTVRTINGTPGLASGKVVEHRGYRHLYLMNVTGGEGPGDGFDLSAQARDMFRRAEVCLWCEGLSFRDVIRTWIYINNIERDYTAFNRVRTQFYREREVMRLPASTGIQGATYPKELGCAMDLYAVVGDQPLKIEVMHARH